MSKKQKKEEKKMLFPNFGIRKEKESFIENLTMLLSSGLNTTSTIRSIEEEIKSKRLKKIVRKISDDIEEGFPLWKALNNSKIFDESNIALIKVGEESGRLSENLKIVSKQTQKNKGFRSKLKSALMYPIFVLVLASVIGIGIAWFILPNLAKIFNNMDIELPAITKFMINLGVFLGNYGIYVVPALILVIILIFYFVFVYKKTKHIGQAITLSIPGIKKLLKELEIARFTYLLGILLDAGIPVSNALDSLISSSSSSLHRYQKFYKHLKADIENGLSFQKSINTYKKIDMLFPRSVQQMIIAAEQSGKLSEILLKISDSYSEKVDSTTKNLMTALEPIMLIIVWLAVVFIALSIILPIYSLVGNFN